MPLHRVWEYRDIGRLSLWGGESDNRGVEVGLVEVILRVSLEVILHHLLRQPSHRLSLASARTLDTRQNPDDVFASLQNPISGQRHREQRLWRANAAER